MTPPSARLLSPPSLLTLLCTLVMASGLLGLVSGAVPTTISEVIFSLIPGTPTEPSIRQTILQLRLPRVLLGLLVGAALGVSGTAMQGLFRNPLVEPGLVGVSSGAALAAVSLSVLGPSLSHGVFGDLLHFADHEVWWLPAATFSGGALTTVLVMMIARQEGGTRGMTLLLAGLAINAIAGSLIGLLAYIASDDALRAATFWMFGSLARASWPQIAVTAPALALAIVLLPRQARALNALQLGEAAATHLGIDVERLKKIMLLWVLLAVGGSVALCGAIGFVGLIAPHAVRLLAGPDHRVVFPASGLMGSALLTFADTLARTLVTPSDIPIGILTSLLGGPFFIVLLIRLRRTGELQ